MAALERAELVATLTFDATRFGGNLITRVALLGGAGRTGFNVLGLVEPRSPRYAQAALSRALEGTLRGRTVTVLAPEDFVIYKLLSTRDRDLEDAVSVLRGLADVLDHAIIDDEAARLAREIPDHPVAARLADVRARAAR